VCDVIEQMFTVDNPRAKRGGIRAMLGEMRKTDVRLADLVKDAVTALRTFG
jgi:electron transfer flavoprotein-quinone oxidoreductase